MILEQITDLLAKVIETYSHQLPIFIGLALLFTVVAIFDSQASKPGKVWWRNPGLFTDVCYALIHGLVGPYLRLPAIIVIFALLHGRIGSGDELADFFYSGRGPLSGWPFWAQAVVHLVLSDFLLYWLHRLLHGATLWRYHAIHHSGEEVDWTTTYRSHPINIVLQPALVYVIMLALGISPEVMLFLLPLDTLTAAWVHSNLNWTLGPLKYVIATPVFHRWHHTLPDEGGNSNFAPTFSFWDWLFGTFYMPAGKQPAVFGTDDPHFPEGYFKQLIYPLKSQDKTDTPLEAGQSADTTAGSR